MWQCGVDVAGLEESYLKVHMNMAVNLNMLLTVHLSNNQLQVPT